MTQIRSIVPRRRLDHPYDKGNIFEMKKPIRADKDSRADQQFSFDEELLVQGHYREWFYDGLQESQLAYLRQPARVDIATQEPVAYDGWEAEQPRMWQHQAACQDIDPVVFFNEGNKPKDAYLKPDAEWREHCPQCPVRETCLEAARDSDSVGIWGGVYRWYDKKTHRIEELDDRV